MPGLLVFTAVGRCLLLGFVLAALFVLAPNAFAHPAHGHAHVISWSSADDQYEELEDPVAMRLVFADGQKKSIRITAANTMGFVYLDRDGGIDQARWVDLSPSALTSSYPKLMDASLATTWLELGGWLSTMENAQRQERIAFKKARQLDPELVTDEAVEDAMQTASARLAEPEEETDKAEESDGGLGGLDEGDDGSIQAPRLGFNNDAWPELSEEQQAQYTQQLQEWAEPFAKEIAPGRWKVAETEYFLLYTDLPREEAKNWAGLLDRMYDRLRVVFSVSEKENIFRGKCLITIWSRQEDFGRWISRSEGISLPPGVLGVCFGKPDGTTHVSFFRQKDPLEFGLVLVHEASHAFTHRFRTGRRIPSWVNEGLAEYVAHTLVNAESFARGRKMWSRRGYDAFGGLGPLFVSEPISAWQYGQAWEFTQMMVDENPSGYRAFINALKDGDYIHDAFEKHYGASLDRLVVHYANVYGRRGTEYVKP